MNLYMTGSSGTGKTSLAQELSARLCMEEAPSVARTSPYPMKSQRMQDYVLHNVDYQCRTSTQSIVTRTPIDVWAYSLLWGLELPTPYVAASYFAQDKSNIILYLPKYWEPADDGFRPIEGQEFVDKAISDFLYTSPDLVNAPIYRVQNESVADRADHVIEWLIDMDLLQ